VALIKCPECGTEISSKAKTCVKCGAPVPRSKRGGCGRLILILFALMVGGTVLASLFGRQGPGPTQQTTTESSTPAATATAPSSGVQNPANDWLLSQSSTGQADMLGKVVGDGCKGKTPFYQGNMKSGASSSTDTRPKLPVLPGTENDAFWSIRCYDGRSYEVEVHPDGSGKVLECSALKAMGAGECFKKF
jgi:hypothetical protein